MTCVLVATAYVSPDGDHRTILPTRWKKCHVKTTMPIAILGF